MHCTPFHSIHSYIYTYIHIPSICWWLASCKSYNSFSYQSQPRNTRGPPFAGAGRWRNCSRSLKNVMPASDLWNRSAEQKYMNCMLRKNQGGIGRFSQLFFSCLCVYVECIFCDQFLGWHLGSVRIWMRIPVGMLQRLITVCSPSCRWDVYLSYLSNIFKISHIESNLIYSYIYIYTIFFSLSCIPCRQASRCRWPWRTLRDMHWMAEHITGFQTRFQSGTQWDLHTISTPWLFNIAMV